MCAVYARTHNTHIHTHTNTRTYIIFYICIWNIVIRPNSYTTDGARQKILCVGGDSHVLRTVCRIGTMRRGPRGEQTIHDPRREICAETARWDRNRCFFLSLSLFLSLRDLPVNGTCSSSVVCCRQKYFATTETVPRSFMCV